MKMRAAGAVYRFLQFFGPGAGCTVLAYVISFFQDENKAAHTRLVAPVALAVFTLMGLVWALWFYFVTGRNFDGPSFKKWEQNYPKKQDDDRPSPPSK